MKVSSSMMRTSVAISAASSRPDSSTSARSVGQVAVENFRGVFFGEAFERHQQKGLTRPRRDLGEMLVRRQDDLSGFRLAVHRDRIPDLREQAVQADARIGAGRQNLRAGNQGIPRWRRHRRRRKPGCRSERGHSGASDGRCWSTACEVDTYTLPFHGPEVTGENAAAQKKFQNQFRRHGTPRPVSALAHVT